MAQIKIKIRGQTIPFDDRLSKADIARILFADESISYTTNEVSKAVPMAYSQAMTIKKKMGKNQPAAKAKARDPLATPQARETAYKTQRGQELKVPSDWGQSARAAGKRTTKPMKSPILDAIKNGKPVDIGRVSGRVGKLRTGGLPSDTAVGECINCGHDLVIRNTGPGVHFTFVHINVSTEDYLAVTQFCHGVPKVLLA